MRNENKCKTQREKENKMHQQEFTHVGHRTDADQNLIDIFDK